ncbi:MAG: L-rhamnose mutarotase [Thermoplasmatales archaeon]|nr:L-rhamnose mutarotase [Thermoplasmatales archaeon]MCW6170365.1 L-rhamnose mutarotase [Thermoplasmatales archaeon]
MRYFFHLKIKESKINEYKERHHNIWPEMIEALKGAGIRNYTIFLEGTDVYGYWECDNFKRTSEFLNKSEINSKWQEYMSDVIVTESSKRLPEESMEVFHLD